MNANDNDYESVEITADGKCVETLTVPEADMEVSSNWTAIQMAMADSIDMDAIEDAPNLMPTKTITVGGQQEALRSSDGERAVLEHIARNSPKAHSSWRMTDGEKMLWASLFAASMAANAPSMSARRCYLKSIHEATVHILQLRCMCDVDIEDSFLREMLTEVEP